MKLNRKLITIIIFVLLIVFSLVLQRVIVRISSSKYDFNTIDELNISKIDGPSFEGDVRLSDITMHYAVYGEGDPLILLHGNGESHLTLEDAALYLANDYEVYAIDSRCHGESSDPGIISYELMAKDVNEFIEKMGLNKPLFVGHSDGAMVGLQLAMDYPDAIKALVSAGANSKPSEFKTYFKVFVRFNNLIKPDKLNDLMMNLPHWEREQLDDISIPVLVTAGEHDIMHLADTVFIFESIPNAKLKIIKNADHCSYMYDGKQCYSLIKDFLDDNK